MSNGFQRLRDSLLRKIPFTTCYDDDILFASKGSLEEQKDILLKILNILKNSIITVKWEKCAFFEKDMKWLIFMISNTELKSIVGKADSIKDLTKPQNISELKFFF